jgi:hypothetical protein
MPVYALFQMSKTTLSRFSGYCNLFVGHDTFCSEQSRNKMLLRDSSCDRHQLVNIADIGRFWIGLHQPSTLLDPTPPVHHKFSG